MRRRAVYEQLGGIDKITPETEEMFRNMLAQEKRANRRMWRMNSGYTMRVGIEGYYSSLKRIFGDEVRSRNPRCAEHEIRLKVAIYNDMIDMAESNGHTGKRILLPSRGGAGGVSGGAGAAGGRRAAGTGDGRPAGAGPDPAGGRRVAGGNADCGAGEGPDPAGGRRVAGGNADCGAGEGLVGAKTEYG